MDPFIYTEALHHTEHHIRTPHHSSLQVLEPFQVPPGFMYPLRVSVYPMGGVYPWGGCLWPLTPHTHQRGQKRTNPMTKCGVLPCLCCVSSGGCATAHHALASVVKVRFNPAQLRLAFPPPPVPL